MRYSEDHKARTHQLILDEAARRFRQLILFIKGSMSARPINSKMYSST